MSFSARISASTPFHFVKTSPLATGSVSSPNGSAKTGVWIAGPATAGDPMDGSAGSSAATFAAPGHRRRPDLRSDPGFDLRSDPGLIEIGSRACSCGRDHDRNDRRITLANALVSPPEGLGETRSNAAMLHTAMRPNILTSLNVRGTALDRALPALFRDGIGRRVSRSAAWTCLR